METISSEIAKEIERRVAAGPFRSVDELLEQALRALDDSRLAAQEWLELELLAGLEGEDVPMHRKDLDDIEREALEILRARKTSGP